MPAPGDDEKRLDRTHGAAKLTGQINQKGTTMARRGGLGFNEDAVPFARRPLDEITTVYEVQASVAKTHFSQLLDEVERGATILVLRHGRPVARIVPEPDGQRQRKKQAIENIRRLAKQIREETGGATVEEILSSIHEGHRI